MPEFTGAASVLTPDGLAAVLTSSGLGQPELWSVLSVETSGCGFLPDGRPKILFERHVFSRLTGHQYDADDPDISQQTAGGYGPGGANQYNRLNAALQLDRSAALQSASWGLGQIMGENFGVAGFPSVDAMVASMSASENAQLSAMVSFLTANQLIDSLKAHDWAGFARRYNGPNYAANNYDGLLEHFYGHYTQVPPPDLTVRAVQIALLNRQFQPGPIDGAAGTATATAIKQFQKSVNLPETGLIDGALLDKLGIPRPPSESAPS